MFTEIAGLLLCCVPVAGVVLLVVFVRRRRDQRLAGEWQRLLDGHARLAGEAAIAVVDHVHQHAEGGAKAVIRWHATDRQQDAWFEGRHPPPGSAWLVRGPGDRNPGTVAIHPGDVIDFAPAGALAAARRRERAAKKTRDGK